jgi:Na+-transporting methylmalonyl-CoA/oxaloacetate decarboxylase gamma subunit
MDTALKATMSIGDSLLLAVVGMAIVFFVLIVLMAVIKIIRGVIASMEANAALAAPAAAAPAAPAKPAANMVPAKGSLGEIMLHNVDDKTAAMIMAIVADELKAPLNELRFLSIREKI